KSVDKAIKEFENASNVHPTAVQPHIILGMLYEAQNSSDKAQFHYRQALKLDPHSPVAANNLAWSLADSDQSLAEALTFARIATERLPNAPNVMDTRGWIYYKTGAYTSAVEFLKQSVAKSPGNPVYHLDRKSTRLNSSHVSISYAVFCLKKKTQNFTAVCIV